MSDPVERSVRTTVHGRCLVRLAAAGAPVLAGFHGYAESADVQMRRLEAVPGSERWTCISIQGLHRFYRRRSDEVVASWMTRQDRELMIADNVDYVASAIDAVSDAGRLLVVAAGFSQGVSMAFRAAGLGRLAIAAVVACGGDVPPELGADALGRAGRVLIGRGRDDPAYAHATFINDVARLQAAGVIVDAVEYDGGHEWTPAFAEAVGRFLERVR